MSTLKLIPVGTKFGAWEVLEYAGRKGNSTFWTCKCDCGAVTAVNGYALRTGTSSKCLSCKMKVLRSPENINKAKKTRLNKRPKGTSAFIELLGQYKRNAKSRGYAWELTGSQFNSLINQSCHYCNRPPSAKWIPWNPEYGVITYNGIDRKDNGVGYLQSNCVTCCKTCNQAKLQMSYEEFREWVKQVYENFGANKWV